MVRFDSSNRLRRAGSRARPRRGPGPRPRSFGLLLPAAIVCLTSLSDCRLFPEWETVFLRIPDPPQDWIECGLDPVWEYRACWIGGETRAEAVSGGRAVLCLPRRETAAVLAYPVWAGRKLRPAGAVYPRAGEGELTLTWEGGYRAEAARVLILTGIDPARFDLERFSREAVARLGDPWLRPPSDFAESLAAETFRVTWLDPPLLFPASVDGLPGPAASDSSFGRALVPDGEGRAVVSLPVGVSRWHAAWGRVSVELRADGEAAWVVTVNSGL